MTDLGNPFHRETAYSSDRLASYCEDGPADDAIKHMVEWLSDQMADAREMHRTEREIAYRMCLLEMCDYLNMKKL